MLNDRVPCCLMLAGKLMEMQHELAKKALAELLAWWIYILRTFSLIILPFT